MIEVELLEYLQLQCGCEYLSDLKYSSRWQAKLLALKNPEQFTLEEWNRTLEYLTEISSNYGSLREVNEYLRNCRKKQEAP